MSAGVRISRLAKAKAERAKVATEVNALESRSVRHEHAVETRRKILVGSCVLATIEAGGTDALALHRILRGALPGHLSRDLDRTLLEDLLTDPGGVSSDKESGEGERVHADG